METATQPTFRNLLKEKAKRCLERFGDLFVPFLHPIFAAIDGIKERFSFIEPYCNAVKAYAPLVSFTCVFLLDMYVLRQYEVVYGEKAIWSSAIFVTLKRFRKFYFTGWNFAVQIFFLVVAILNEIVRLTNFDPDIEDYLNGVRSYIFAAIVFPCSILVTMTFWGLYIYDREFVFPSAMDEFYPIWINHAVHTIILVPLITEILSPKNSNFITIESALFGLTIYLLVYQTMYLSAYFFYGVWLYPIFFHLTWVQKMLFLWIEYALTVSFLTLGIYFQDLKKNVF